MKAFPVIGLIALGVAFAEDDLGPAMSEAEPYKATLTVTNPYDRAVKVETVDSTCACTTLKLHDHFLLPKASTSLDAEVDNNNRSGPQRIGVSLYLTDPDLEPIELMLRWQVIPEITVDSIINDADPLERPADEGYRDIYRYVLQPVRPDELRRLRKRIRLGCPPEHTPPGGLRVTDIQYQGDLWKLTQTTQSNGSILITAEARDPNAKASEGMRDENVILITNHPRKPRISLRFVAVVAKNAGSMVIDPGTLPPK